MKAFIKKIPEAAKAVVAFLILFIPWAATALPDGKVSAGEWWQLALVFATPAGVWATKNKAADAPPAA